ncbi:uncharacterized protein LOC135465626 isoform X2 [Liolophura sinensis]|uniref:uncharacterized protein LOC135465626 isoform X2 n=1 Tax=Liolophura sinensis TaxID=3198878 RepID=UPI003158BB6C
MADKSGNGLSLLSDLQREITHDQAKEAFDNNDFRHATELYTELLKTNNINVQYLINRAIAYVQLEQPVKSLEDSKTIISVEAFNPKGYLLAGRSCLMLKRFEDALSFYQRGLQVDPKNKEIASDLKNMQKVIVKEYEARGSEKGYNAVKFCSQDPYPGDDALLVMEQEILDMKHLRKAKTLTEMAPTNKRDPKVAVNEAMIGEQHRRRGDYPRALHHLGNAVVLDPANISVRYLRALAYHQHGDAPSAIADLIAIPKPARHKDVWKSGGTILQDLHLPVMAELWLRRATRLSEDGDDECAMMFQEARVKRLYDPMTVHFPVRVRFTVYGRAVYSKTDIGKDTIVMKDEPIVCGNSLDTWKQPACHHCGRSLMTMMDYFGNTNHLSEHQRQVVEENWPEVEVVPCDFCQKEVYCSAFCRQEAWERFHSVLCPSKSPAVSKLYEICENNGKMYDSQTRTWKEVWAAAFTPFILAKMWAFVVCQVRKLMKEDGSEEPSLEHWAKAKAPLRRFIAFGATEASGRFPEVMKLMQEIFSTCDPVVRYDISEKEFDGRYFQATCNLQSFSSPLNGYKEFINKLNSLDVLKTMTMLKVVEEKPKEALFTGLFPLHACLNHSCLNTVEVMDGEYRGKPGIWVRAKRDIRADEELFTTYIDTKMPRKLRRAWLYRSFNFWCQCRRCQFEGDEPETCTNCFTTAPPGKKFPGCGKCKKAWYCSVKCQKQSWQKGHKEICMHYMG